MSLLLLFSNDKWSALTGQGSDLRCGIIRADWHIDSATGQPVANETLAIGGSVTISAAGIIPPELAQALAGLASTGGHGTVVPSADLPLSGADISSGIGTLIPGWTVSLDGLESTVESGVVTPSSDGLFPSEGLSGQESLAETGLVALDVALALDGLESTSESGALDTDSTFDQAYALSGISMQSEQGILGETGGIEAGDDLFDLQRRRKFGRVSTPLVRQWPPRRVR